MRYNMNEPLALQLLINIVLMIMIIVCNLLLVLRSNYLLQILITDDRETAIGVLAVLQSAVRVNP